MKYVGTYDSKENKIGMRTTFQSDGQKDSEGMYINGNKTSLWTTWRFNGQKWTEDMK